MPILQVLSSRPRAGKTGLAAGLAQGIALHGRTVQLLRVGSSEDAKGDAAAFSDMPFASSPAEPVAPGAVKPAADTVTIVELDAGAEPTNAPAIVVVRGEMSEADLALGKKLGARLVGSVAMMVPPGAVDAIGRGLTDADLRPLAVLPEDPRLASPSVKDIRHALAADVLYEGENFDASIENVLVAPVYTDGAKTHFWRFGGSKAVLTPSYKTDLLLAAIEADASCVIVTGGHKPSHYVIDRVQGQPVTLLLAPQQTPAAVTAMSDVWGSSAFAGKAKAAAMFELLNTRLDWAALLQKLS
jgi:hypothetical protein